MVKRTDVTVDRSVEGGVGTPRVPCPKLAHCQQVEYETGAVCRCPGFVPGSTANRPSVQSHERREAVQRFGMYWGTFVSIGSRSEFATAIRELMEKVT